MTAMIASAIRLAALGMLWEGPQRYGDLTATVRQYVTRTLGPTADIMGTPLELLRHQGLIERVAEGAGGDETLGLTERGRRDLRELMSAPLPGHDPALAGLLVALKLRFLDLLAPERRHELLALIDRHLAGEADRLRNLHAVHALAPAGEAAGRMARWLGHEAELVQARVRWIRAERDRLAEGAAVGPPAGDPASPEP